MKVLYKRILSGVSAGFLCFLLTACQQNNDINSGSQSGADDVVSSSTKEDKENAPNDLSNAAMVGNSYLYGFDTYAVLPETDCFYRVGLNVRTVFTETMIDGEVPVIEELKNDKEYDEVLLMFGENELGWPNEQAFLDGYGEIIDAVNEYQPKATVYVQSMLPVSKEVSDKNKDGVNNENIRQRNEKLKEIAEEKDAVYLDVASIMENDNGDLPKDAATDGIHPNISYYRQWADFLKENVN